MSVDGSSGTPTTRPRHPIGNCTFTGQILLINRSAHLQDLTDEVFQQLHDDPRLGRRRSPFHAVHRAVAGLGFAPPPLLPTGGGGRWPLAQYHAEFANAARVRFERLLPPDNLDWNDVLKKGRG
jgi:hypothetical protein